MDVPRRFVYEIQTATGSVVNLAYTAFPPSPAGDVQRRKIRLDFHEGRIRVGHHLRACGSYDQDAQMLTVEDEGDFIETFSEDT